VYSQLRAKAEDLIERWEARQAEYIFIRAEYSVALPSSTDEELFAILRRAELKISSVLTHHLYTDSASYFAAIDGIQFVQFEDMLNNTIPAILNFHRFSSLIPEMQTLAGQLPPFDIVGINIEEELKRVRIFADDLLTAAENLSRNARA
jgi:hypothetical protein